MQKGLPPMRSARILCSTKAHTQQHSDSKAKARASQKAGLLCRSTQLGDSPAQPPARYRPHRTKRGGGLLGVPPRPVTPASSASAAPPSGGTAKHTQSLQVAGRLQLPGGRSHAQRTPRPTPLTRVTVRRYTHQVPSCHLIVFMSHMFNNALTVVGALLK